MTNAGPKAVYEIVSQAGGCIVGRTKLQKSVCVLELTGLGYGFHFSYKHFGPYSEELKFACNDASALGLIREQRKIAAWGGEYSVFLVDETDDAARQSPRGQLLRVMVSADPVLLELAVTAGFLAANKVLEPWSEVMERKQDKATIAAIDGAKELYREMCSIHTPRPLPVIL